MALVQQLLPNGIHNQFCTLVAAGVNRIILMLQLLLSCEKYSLSLNCRLVQQNSM